MVTGLCGLVGGEEGSVDVECVVCAEAAPFDGVLVVGLAFVESRVLLRGRIDLHLRLDAVLADLVLVHLSRLLIVMI